MASSSPPAYGDELPSSCVPEYELQTSFDSLGFPEDCRDEATEVSPAQSPIKHVGAWIHERGATEAERSARPDHHDRRGSASLTQRSTCDSPTTTATSGAGSLLAALPRHPSSGLYRTDAGVLLTSADVQRPIATATATGSDHDSSTTTTTTTTHQSLDTAGSSKRAIPRIPTSSPRAPKPKLDMPCPEQDCKVTFGRKGDRQRHLDTVHRQSDERFKCGAATCRYTYPRKDKVYEHVRNAGEGHFGPGEARVVAFSVSRSTSLAGTGSHGSSTTSTE